MTIIENFVDDRNNYKPIVSFDTLRKRLDEPISNDETLRNINRSDFFNLCYASEHDEEIEVAVDVIKRNREKLLEYKERRWSQQLAKLLFALNKVDKFLELFNDKVKFDLNLFGVVILIFAIND